MLEKFFSIFSDKQTTGGTFDILKRMSDYVGILMRLAFLSLMQRLIWVMYESGAFGSKHPATVAFFAYTASAFVFILAAGMSVAFIVLTFRATGEVFDEITGFNLENITALNFFFLLFRGFICTIVAIYAGVFLLSVSSATQDIGEYIAAQETHRK